MAEGGTRPRASRAEGASVSVGVERIWYEERPTFLTVLILGLVAVVAVIVLTPTVYSASATLGVQAGPEAGDDATADREQVLARSFAEVLDSDAVRSAVAPELPFELSVAELASKVDSEALTQTVLIEVTASDEDPERASTIANVYAESFSERVRTTDAYQGSSAELLVEAVPPTEPVKPRPVLYAIIGGFAAFVAAAAVALMIGATRYSG